jgi:hypothetical protein
MSTENQYAKSCYRLRPGRDFKYLDNFIEQNFIGVNFGVNQDLNSHIYEDAAAFNEWVIRSILAQARIGLRLEQGLLAELCIQWAPGCSKMTWCFALTTKRGTASARFAVLITTR